MYEPLHLSGVDYLAQDRITELVAIAAEVKGVRRDAGQRSGMLTRSRLTLGRRLISLGTAVAGPHA
jgi:hypothetical protein